MIVLSLKDFRLDWDKLKTFYYVARLKSFSAVGRYLHLDHTAVSRSIQKLENQLQTRLFYRNRATQILQLTEKGAVLFNIVEKCYLEMQQVNLLLNEDNSLQGELKIAVSAEISSFCLTPYFSDFLKEYPDICLVIEETDHMPTFDIYETDALIHPFIKEREDLNQHLIATIAYELYASKTYMDQFGMLQKLEDLNGHRLIGSRYTSSLFPDITPFVSTEAKQVTKPCMQINSVATRVQLAAESLGIIAAPQNHLAVKRENLIQVLPDIPSPSLDIYYIYPKQFEPLKRIKVLVEYLKTKLNE